MPISAPILDDSLTTQKLDPTTVRSIVGLSDTAATRRGKSIIAGTESRSSTSYGLMATADRVQNVVLPTDGLICVLYQATWQESVMYAARAAIFVGANQLKIAGAHFAAPITQAASRGGDTPNADSPLHTTTFGLISGGVYSGSPAYTGDVTTGQVIAQYGGHAQFGGGEFNGSDVSIFGSTGGEVHVHGGSCAIFAAAGTYDISVQFKSSSGSVTVKNRKLWVWTMGF